MILEEVYGRNAVAHQWVKTLKRVGKLPRFILTGCLPAFKSPAACAESLWSAPFRPGPEGTSPRLWLDRHRFRTCGPTKKTLCPGFYRGERLRNDGCDDRPE